jgi:hypothetical protein
MRKIAQLLLYHTIMESTTQIAVCSYLNIGMVALRLLKYT